MLHRMGAPQPLQPALEESHRILLQGLDCSSEFTLEATAQAKCRRFQAYLGRSEPLFELHQTLVFETRTTQIERVHSFCLQKLGELMNQEVRAPKFHPFGGG